MTKENIETQAALYEDSCHTSSTQKHFCDGAEWAKQELETGQQTSDQTDNNN